MNKEHEKLGKKTIAIAAGIILFTACIIAGGLYLKNGLLGSDVKLCKYTGIKLSLPKAEITKDRIKETAEWQISYYNESLKGSKDEEDKKLSVDSLTDAQVKEAFQLDSVDAFYDSMKKYLEDEDKKQQRTEAFDQICNYLLANCTVENLSERELKKRLDKNIQDTKDSCEKYYNMTYKEYCKSVGMTEEEYEKSLSGEVEKSYKKELILTAIADKENIQYDEKEFKAYIKDLVDRGGYESEKDIYDMYGEDYLKTAYRVEYVTDWLMGKADITYVEKAESTSKPPEALPKNKPASKTEKSSETAKP